jgi:hypothetical protein
MHYLAKFLVILGYATGQAKHNFLLQILPSAQPPIPAAFLSGLSIGLQGIRCILPTRPKAL